MTRDRSFLLDLALGISVGLVYFYTASYDRMSTRHIAVSISCGVGAYLFARYFLREFFFSRQPATVQDLEKELERIEDYLEKYDELPEEQRAGLLEQAGSIAMALERWDIVIDHYEELSTMILESQKEHPDEHEEHERQWFHVQLALCYSLFQQGRREESIERLETLRASSLTRSETIFKLLIDMFQIRIIAQDDLSKGKAMLEEALANAKEEGHEEDALRLVASEWVELGQPETAIDLLEQAMTLAQEKKDRQTESEVLYQMGFAYGAAGNLPQAARILVQLTRNYVHSNFPTPVQIEQLRRKLYEHFGAEQVQDAYNDAKRQAG